MDFCVCNKRMNLNLNNATKQIQSIDLFLHSCINYNITGVAYINIIIIFSYIINMVRG